MTDCACEPVLKILGQALVRVAGKCVPMAVLVEFCPKCRQHFPLSPGWFRRHVNIRARTTLRPPDEAQV